MTIASICSALQTRHAAITGVKVATTVYPPSIEASDCPCVLVDPWRGKTSWETHGGDLAIVERVYRVRVFCQPAVFNLDQGKQAAITLLEAFMQSYKDSATVTSTAAILIERAVEDAGVVETLAYGENAYIGFTVLLPIEERDE